MNNISNNSVIVNFDYKNKLVTIKTNPFKHLEEIKKIAIKKFNIMNNINLNYEDLNCYYLGRNLYDYENQKICELFSNREKISIKLMSPKKQLTIDTNNSSSKNNIVSTTPNSSPSRRNYFSNFIKNTNVYSSGFNSIGRIKKNKNSVMYKIFTERLKIKNCLFPKIKNSRNNSSSSNKVIHTEIEDNYFIPSKIEKNNNSSGIGIICGKCHENNISEYCRTCNEFICSECKDNNEHYNHLNIHLRGEDLQDNINLYGSLVQTDIEENIFNNNNLLNKEKIISIIEQKNLIGKNEELIHKLENIIKIYQNILDILKNNYNKDFKNKMNGLIQNFMNGSSLINNEITNIMNNVNSQNKKNFDFNELKSFFDRINNEEIKLYELNQNLIKYHLSTEINFKVNFLYSKINKILDNAVDIKSLFNLEPKYYNELIKLINLDKSKNGFNRNYKTYKTSNIVDFNISQDKSGENDKKDIDNNNKEKVKKILKRNLKSEKNVKK